MAIKKRPVSPRQKMINLMYVVLMALLALNVSTEVLNGFSLVEDSLKRTTLNATMENIAIYDDFAVQMKKNPQKVKQWYDKSQKVKEMSNNLYNLADELKLAIVQEADGKDGDVRNIRNKEDLEAATQVMLAPGRGRGKELYDAINAYRNSMLGMVTDYKQKKVIASNLTTEIPKDVTDLHTRMRIRHRVREASSIHTWVTETRFQATRESLQELISKEISTSLPIWFGTR